MVVKSWPDSVSIVFFIIEIVENFFKNVNIT